MFISCLATGASALIQKPSQTRRDPDSTSELELSKRQREQVAFDSKLSDVLPKLMMFA